MRTYKIVQGQHGSGGFMCPPGYPNHTYSAHEFNGPRGRTVVGISSLEYLLTDEADAAPAVRERARKILESAKVAESEGWVRSVYGYFRNMYLPESGSLNASDLVSHKPVEIVVRRTETFLGVLGDRVQAEAKERAERASEGGAVPAGRNPKDFRRGNSMRGKRRGYEVTAKWDGSTVYVYALADDGERYDADHLDDYASVLVDGFTNVRREPMSDDHAGRVVADVVDVPSPMDPQRHAAVATIRKYFPEHEPRLDLIEDPSKGYGSWPCTKCGERVQYEARYDKHTVVSTRLSGSGITQWSYGLECTDGGPHTVD
ncbi:hypothetical protein [Streptomyces sp. BH105]|uniref:hypothetical protein n=1 Tax=Streptomyces sp. BH105 TaxID=3410408 RepID=UPI003CF839D1